MTISDITKKLSAARACAATRKAKERNNKRTALMLTCAVIADLTLTGMTWKGADFSAEIAVDGCIIPVRASGETVSAVLKREGIILGEYDIMNVAPEERVTAGMSIAVDRVEYIEKTISEPVAYETVRTENTLEKIGTQRLITFGEYGRTDTTVKEKLVNGEVVSTEVISETLIPPVNEHISVGTAINEPYSRKTGGFSLIDGVPAEYEYVLSGKVTAYTAPKGAGTYSGRPLEIGSVGVDPNVIPFGSEVYIMSKDGSHVYGYAIASDTGDITDIIADVYMGVTSEHYSDACRWGAQDAYVYVLKKGDNSLLW